MASLGTVSVDAKDIASQLTVNVIIRRGREWRWRLWVSIQLIRLACWIAWTDYEIADCDVLAKETKTFNDQRDWLLDNDEGRYVLIHGSDVCATFTDEMDAIADGHKQFGNVPFLVRKISKVDNRDVMSSTQ